MCKLVRKFCDIPRECRSTLQYLSSFSTLALYSNVSELERSSLICSAGQRSYCLVTALDNSTCRQASEKLKEERTMSWSFAHYLLLQKGVKESQLMSIFNTSAASVRHHLSHNHIIEKLKAVLKVGKSFFVSCLLEKDMVTSWHGNKWLLLYSCNFLHLSYFVLKGLM